MILIVRELNVWVRQLRLMMIALAVALGFCAPVKAGEPSVTETITIGQSYTVATHEAERRINVALPDGYDGGEEEYPLIIVLDGGLQQDFFLTFGMMRWNQLWQRSAPGIFVGIETVDRQRELLPPTTSTNEQANYPSAGESSAFREWLSAEILPFLRDRYRDDGRAFLIGESAAGHFVAETWVHEPDLFDGYAAFSPSLQWSDQVLVKQLESAANRGRPKLYISLANEGGTTEDGVLRFVKAAVSPLCFSDRRKDLVHANALHGLFPEALQFLLPTPADWLEEYGLTLRCDNVADY